MVHRRQDSRAPSHPIPKNLKPRLRNDILVDNSVSTKKHARIPANKHPPDDSARIARGLGGYTRGCARAHPLTKRNFPHWQIRKNRQTILPESPGGSGSTPAGVLTRTHRQDKNPLDDSTRIARGLRGSCRVHKPRVPHGPASQQRLGPADNIVNNAQLLG